MAEIHSRARWAREERNDLCDGGTIVYVLVEATLEVAENGLGKEHT